MDKDPQKIKLSLAKILESENIADELTDDQLDVLGMECANRYEADKTSRAGWEQMMERGFDLAMQVTKKKNYPFEGAANVKFPVVTIAAIQFNARAYPSIIPGADIVKCRSIGPDEDGEKKKRADRISAHMNYQLTEEDEGWEEDMDTLLLALPILGCGFKKTYFDYEKQHLCSRYVSPENLVVNYYASSLEDAECITEVLGEYSKREVTELTRQGFYRKQDFSQPVFGATHNEYAHEREGSTAPTSGDTGIEHFVFLEQHCYIDLDGDGYEEPYVVTFEKMSQKVVRIIPRFDEDSIIYSRRNSKEIAKIFPEHYYTKYKFIPAPDGSFYELGFGHLIAPVNEAINTNINLLLDAGKLANLPSGFIGKGARLKKGDYVFKPGEFKTINATGDDVRKNVFMLPVRDPSSTLFNLLSLLIDYAERISGVTDMMVGKTPGQNTPATTSMASLEQGQKVFSGVYKRIWRCARKEFSRIYELNARYLDSVEYFQVVDGQDEQVYYTDYQGDPSDVKPAADPNVASDQLAVLKAEAVANRAAAVPGYNIHAVERRYLEALKIPAIDEVLPPPGSENAPQPPEPPLKEQAAMMKVQAEAEYRQAKLPFELDLIDAQVAALEAKALKDLNEAEAVDDRVMIEKQKALLTSLGKQRDNIKAKKESIDAQDQTEQGGVPSMEGESAHRRVPTQLST